MKISKSGSVCRWWGGEGQLYMKWLCSALGPILATSLEPSTYCWNVTRLRHFNQYQYVHLNWLSWFLFFIIVGVSLTILIDCMIFVSPFPYFKPFVPNAPFLYPLKISENLPVFWCLQGIEKGCLCNEWVKRMSQAIGLLSFSICFSYFFLLFLATPCLVVAFSSLHWVNPKI